MEKDDEEQLVTQDDIQNLKNDISSLRYELLDALSKNSARDRVRQAEATAVSQYFENSLRTLRHSFKKNRPDAV